MSDRGKLKGDFSKRSSINFTILNHSLLMLEVQGAKAGAWKVITQGLMFFAKINVIFLDTGSKVGLGNKAVRSRVNVGVTTDSDHGKVGDEVQGRRGGNVKAVGKVLKGVNGRRGSRRCGKQRIRERYIFKES